MIIAGYVATARRLENNLALVERQLVVAPPKLSAKQIGDSFAELKANDALIARTIFNAALDAADPLRTGRRYLGEFHAIVRPLQRLDRGAARTFANGTFMAHARARRRWLGPERSADARVRFRTPVTH